MTESNSSIRGFAKRIQSIRTQLDVLKEDERDIYAEVKAAGHNKKALREAIKREEQDPAEREAFEAVVADYASQLDMFADKAA